MQQAETISKEGLYRGYQALAVLTAVLLIVQPVLAARSLYDDPDYIDIHGIIANVIFLTVAAQTVVCFLGRSKWGFTTVIWNLVLVALVSAQIGLGYSAEDSDSSAEIHIPLGVFIFGVGLVNAMLAFFDIKRQR